MKILTTAILFLMLVSVVAAATFTAKASGDWQSAATWGTSGTGCHVAYPCQTDTYSAGPTDGDNVNLAGFTVTCTNQNEVCTVGNSGSTTSSCTAGTAAIVSAAGSGGLTIGSSATFIYAGPVCLTFGTITFQPGARIYHDSSWAATPVSYAFLGTDGSNHSALWAMGTLGGTRVVIEGDSFYSPTKYSGNCTTANIAGCKAGTMGGSNSLESGEGNFYNVTFQDFGGTGNAFMNYTINTSSSIFSGLLMTNSASLSIRMGGNKNVTIDKSKFTATSGSSPCLYFGAGFAGTGTVTVTNSVIECPIAPPLLTATAYIWRNDICSTTWASGTYYTAGISNLRPCSIGNDSGTYDQVFFDSDGWNTGAAENSNSKASVGVIQLTNSVMWVPRNVGPSGSHNHPLSQAWTGLVGGSWVQRNNVYGSFGDTDSTASAEAHQTGNPNGGTPTSTTTIMITGNVNLCGYQGRGSVTANGQFYSVGGTNYSTMARDSVNARNNTYCASAATLAASQQGDGSSAAEAGAAGNSPTQGMTNSNANTYFRNDVYGTNTPGAGAVPEVFDSTANAVYVNTPPWHTVNYNLVLNTSLAASGSAPCGTNGNNCAWALTAPTTSTELIIAAVNPSNYMVDPTRSVPNFSEYLDASGLFPISNYTGAAQYKGAWATGRPYVMGDIVSYSNPQAYNGRTTYWICKNGHSSSSNNAPIVGYDSSNPYAGPTEFWESAWISMWMKPTILAGTSYVDGSVQPLYNSTTMYAVGLLNAWLRQGFVNIDPRLWGGQGAAPGCSTDGGATWTECGAVPLPAARHIPPSAMTN